MEDSNILYYVILGAIYFLSKIFGKKKKPIPMENMEEVPVPDQSTSTQSDAPTFEDVFKELTGQAPELTPEERTTPLQPKEVEPVLATELVDLQRRNVEAIEPDELIDIVPHQQIERAKPKFERSEKFKIKEEDHELQDGLMELLADQDGLKKAVVLREILDRKY